MYIIDENDDNILAEEHVSTIYAETKKK